MSPNVRWSCILLSLTVSGVFCVGFTDGFAAAVAEEHRKCAVACPYQNHSGSDIEQFDTLDVCPVSCRIEQCILGCNLLEKALESSCAIVCDGTEGQLSAASMQCALGCNEALSLHFARLRRLVGTPAAPALVADSLTATSLALAWGGPPLPRDVPARPGRLLAQWRYEEHNAAWHFCGNHTWDNDSSVVTVDGLHPYTKYRFRVAILLNCRHCEPIVSEPSVVISTLPAGKPLSRPSREIPSQMSPHYLWTDLKPNRQYEVKVSMRNAEGQGPAAVATVTTLPTQKVAEEERPLLIFSSQSSILRQSLDLLEVPDILYLSEGAAIRGTAVHVAKSTLFFSDADGYVRRKLIDDRAIGYKHKSEVIIKPSTVQFKAYDLSVDWLNNHLYILGQVTHEGVEVWQIARSNLDGQSITVAIGGIRMKPRQIEVDPYNGYIFWITAQGLFRLDLANVSNGVKHDTSPELILQRQDLLAFSLDSTRFRLLVPLHDKNTVISISLDGKHKDENIRNNTINPKFQNATSLVYIKERFYWINGDKVWIEDYHESHNEYFHNSFATQSTKIIALTASAQPVPVPVNPPIKAQALLGNDLAQVSWQPPHGLATQGRGAWQRWSYEILLRDEIRNVSRTSMVITGTDVTVPGLHADTEYHLKVAAYTSSGKGPWSAEFISRTLPRPLPNQDIGIFWSTASGLLHSDVTGSQLDTVISNSEFGGGIITDIDWFEDVLYLVLNASVYTYNTTSRSLGRYGDLEAVGSIAVDWLGKKLYWASPNHQMIYRGNLLGDARESLPMLALARELRVDPVKGYIYYSTELKVECNRLHGDRKRTYFELEVFAGKRVIGLTLDFARRLVLWIIQSHEGSFLYSAPMTDAIPYDHAVKTTSVPLQESARQGPLCQFAGRLLWLRDGDSAAVSDTDGNYTAVVASAGLAGMRALAVREPSARRILGLDHDGPVHVIPEQVDGDSIAVNGTWKCFNITWAPVKNVNYGDIFYDVRVQTGGPYNNISVETKDNYVIYNNSLPAYSVMEVSVKAFTNWGYSTKVKRQLNSPVSEPSVVQRVRAFVERGGDPLDDPAQRPRSAVLRWDPPGRPNGPLRSYLVQAACAGRQLELPTDQTHYRLDELESNASCSFQVKASTAAGYGVASDPVIIDTESEIPVPRLLVVAAHSLLELDFDNGHNKTIFTSVGSSVIEHIALLKRENLIFISNSLNEIIMINGTKEYKILSLNSSIKSMTVDWVQRVLYWSQIDETGHGSKIFVLDLNYNLKHPRPRVILTSTGLFGNLQISPLSRTLYIVESTSEGFQHLLKSSNDGSSLSPFFRQDGNDPRCNCTHEPFLSDTIALGMSHPETPDIYWIESNTKDIMVADFHGCNCSMAVIASDAMKLSVDEGNIYWTNSPGVIHALTKTNIHTIMTVAQLQNVVSLGIQTYPPRKCLGPGQTPSLEELMVNHSSHSITLIIPKAKRNRGCANAPPAVRYHVRYANYSNRELSCKNASLKVESTAQQIEIRHLQPYKRYYFCIGVTNFYDDEEGRSMTLSKPAVYMTAPGAPSAPRNITAVPLSPNEALVYWILPARLNSQSIKYEVYSSGTKLGDGPIQDITSIDDPSNMPMQMQLQKLSPNRTYNITVRAICVQNTALYTDSAIANITTYPEPRAITLLQNASTYLIVEWKGSHRHIMQYTKLGDVREQKWKKVSILVPSDESDSFIYNVTDLKPNTRYIFRLKLSYHEENVTNFMATQKIAYIWPTDRNIIFGTLCDRPSVPGAPKIEHIKNSVYEVKWGGSVENGSPLTAYSLEGLRGEYGLSKYQVESFRKQMTENFTNSLQTEYESEDFNIKWKEFYNGTETYCHVSELPPGMYTFRVRALNGLGWSEYSELSTPIDLSGATVLARHNEKIVVVVLVSVFITVLIIVCIAYTLNRRTRGLKKIALSQHASSVAAVRGPDIELATLRELPRRCTFVHSSNALYSGEGPPTDAEIAALPHISRDQITLLKFLGSGAFGEVFEGNARLGDDVKVAVKTLRKGATEHEKMEFLQEARLMGNFKHRHILQLLGVCLDNDPHFIIMELMEGGDLLSYLRLNRTTQSLGLDDLLGMCLDVAIGCAYLEEMHFVHRDLACRNCLVSTNSPNGRIVKIGDFGLARDIYKNDYYRKEGEGLLPVRWMAPESLVDGVFSCQSDVWAFGVLCWEVLTYGQQPYPARSNLEVLHYVREGGRLCKPSICPNDLHQLMLSCWNHDATKRPMFKECVQILSQLKSPNHQIESTKHGSPVTPMSSAENSQETLALSGSDERDGPRYLELLHDESGTADGYEVPIGAGGTFGPRLKVVLPPAAANGPHSLDSLLPLAAKMQLK